MKNNGGPAYPMQVQLHNGTDNYRGLTVRDWFAGMALTGLCMAHDKDAGLNRREFLEAYPEASYAFADAMIAEREKV